MRIYWFVKCHKCTRVIQNRANDVETKRLVGTKVFCDPKTAVKKNPQEQKKTVKTDTLIVTPGD